MRRLLVVALALVASSACASGGAARPPAAASRTQPAPTLPADTASPLRQRWLDMFARGYFPGRSGQIFIVPREGDIITERDPLYVFMHG